MKKLFFTLLSIATMFACSDDDDGTALPFEGDSRVFILNAVGDSGVSDKATITENENGSFVVELDLDGTSEGNIYPAHIHFNSAAEGGSIAISLEPVDGATGMSTITISQRDDGTPITYNEVVNFDGHFNVHQSSDALETIVAQGDMGTEGGGEWDY